MGRFDSRLTVCRRAIAVSLVFVLCAFSALSTFFLVSERAECVGAPPRKCYFPSHVADFSDFRWRIGLRVIRGAQDTRRAGAPLHSRHPHCFGWIYRGYMGPHSINIRVQWCISTSLNPPKKHI